MSWRLTVHGKSLKSPVSRIKIYLLPSVVGQEEGVVTSNKNPTATLASRRLG
ncbi:MAG: hypothetical protein U0Z75_08525 [Deinococcaceae bacterium]